MKSQTAGLLTIGMLAILGWFPARAEACTCGMSGEPCQATWNADVTGMRFEGLRRRGKWILIDLAAEENPSPQPPPPGGEGEG